MVDFAVRKSYLELYGNCENSKDPSKLKEGFTNCKDPKEAIEKFSNNKPQFHYGQVDYQQFKGSYATFSGVYRRKVIAIPFAAYAGIVKSTHHLASTIFLIIKMGTSDYRVNLEDKNYVKAHLYFVARDLQESYGWFTAIFNECYGQYHIQESELHKTLYSNFIDNFKDITKTSSTMLLDKELQEIKNYNGTHYTRDSESFLYRCIHLSRSYIRLNMLEKAFEVMDLIFLSNTDVQETLLQIALPSIEQDNSHLAERVVRKLCATTSHSTVEDFSDIVAALITENKDDIAKEFIRLISSNKPDWKSQLVLVMIEEYLSNDELAKSQQTIEDEIDNESEKADLFLPVMQAYLSKDELESAFKIANELLTEAAMKDSLIDKFIDYCIEKQNVLLALEKLNFMSNTASNKKLTLDKTISGCRNEEDIECTYKYIIAHTDPEDFLHYQNDIANAFIKIGNEAKGLDIFSRQLLTDNKSEALVNIIKVHLVKRNFDEAFKIFSMHICSLEGSDRDVVYDTIADHFVNNYPLDETFRHLNKLSFGVFQDLVLAHMIRIYDRKENSYNTSAILKEMLKKALYNRAVLGLEKTSFNKKVNNPDLKKTVDDFLEDLIQKNMNDIRYGPPKRILSVVKTMASYGAYLKFQYLNAKNNESDDDVEIKSPLSTKMDTMTPLQILGLSLGASQDQIRKKHRQLSMQHHPDRVHKTHLETDDEFEFRDQSSKEMVKYINNAYEALSS